MSKLLLLVCLFGLAAFALSAENPSLVFNIFRHGARAPIKGYYDKNWAKAEYSQLTPIGERMHYVLGAALAKKYAHILGKPYNPESILIRASLSPRCYASALFQLNGIYKGPKPVANKAFPNTLAEVPFDKTIVDQVVKEIDSPSYKTGEAFDEARMISVPKKVDVILENTKTCPRLITDTAKNLLSSKFVKFWNEYFSPTKEALKKLNLDVPNPYKVAKLADSLICNYWGNKAMPGNIAYKSDLFNDVVFARDWSLLHVNYGSERQTQLLPVPIYDEVLGLMDQKAAGKTKTEFVFLSTHDTTQLTILKNLGIITEDCLLENYLATKKKQTPPKPFCRLPPFASPILIEFYENKGSPYVVFKYNDVAVPLCGGKTECPYKDFKALIAKTTNNQHLKDYKDTCMNELRNDVAGFFSGVKGFFKGKKEAEKVKLWEEDQAQEEKEEEENIQ